MMIYKNFFALDSEIKSPSKLILSKLTKVGGEITLGLSHKINLRKKYVALILRKVNNIDKAFLAQCQSSALNELIHGGSVNARCHFL